jgi:hypothetical protein
MITESGNIDSCFSTSLPDGISWSNFKRFIVDENLDFIVEQFRSLESVLAHLLERLFGSLLEKFKHLF